VIQELDDFFDSESEKPQGPIFESLQKNIDQEAAFWYNNFLDLNMNDKNLVTKKSIKELRKVPSGKSRITYNSSSKSVTKKNRDSSRGSSAIPRKVSRATPVLKGLELKRNAIGSASRIFRRVR